MASDDDVVVVVRISTSLSESTSIRSVPFEELFVVPVDKEPGLARGTLTFFVPLVVVLRTEPKYPLQRMCNGAIACGRRFINWK